MADIEYMFDEIDSVLLDDAVDEFLDAEIDELCAEGHGGIEYMLDNELEPLVESGVVTEDMQLTSGANDASISLIKNGINIRISVEDLTPPPTTTVVPVPVPVHDDTDSVDDDDFALDSDDDDDYESSDELDTPEKEVLDEDDDKDEDDKKDEDKKEDKD